MIYTERKVTIKNDVATIDMPILLFRGDREVEIQFTIIDSKFKFESNRGNVIDKTQATYGQLAVALPDGTDLFTEIVECENGVVIFSISGEMIDEIREVGFYSFHIRLYNDDKTSRITLPPVMKGIEIREPLIIEGDVENTDLVGEATVGYSMVQDRGVEEPIFDEEGNYIPTVWAEGDTITAEKLNKIEEAIKTSNDEMGWKLLSYEFHSGYINSQNGTNGVLNYWLTEAANCNSIKIDTTTIKKFKINILDVTGVNRFRIAFMRERVDELKFHTTRANSSKPNEVIMLDKSIPETYEIEVPTHINSIYIQLTNTSFSLNTDIELYYANKQTNNGELYIEASNILNNNDAIGIYESNINFADSIAEVIPSDIYEIYSDLLSRFPDYVSEEILGTDSLNNDIKCYTFNKPYPQRQYIDDSVTNDIPYETDVRPKIIINSGTHGDEKGSALALSLFLKELCENDTNSSIRYIKNNIILKVIPILNPSGMNANTRNNVNNVNINRDFLDKSQLETRIMVNFIQNNLDSIAILDFHNTVGKPSFWNRLDDPTMLELSLSVLTNISDIWLKRNPLYEAYVPLGAIVDSNTGGGSLKDYATSLGILSTTVESARHSSAVSGVSSTSFNVEGMNMGVELLVNLMLSILKRQPQTQVNKKITIDDVDFIDVVTGINACNNNNSKIGFYNAEGVYSSSSNYRHNEIEVEPGQILKGITGNNVNYKIFVLLDDNNDIIGVTSKDSTYITTRTYITIDTVGYFCYEFTVPEGVSKIYYQYEAAMIGVSDMIVIDADMPSSYTPYIEELMLDENIYAQNSKKAEYANNIVSSLNGKNIGFLGDSFTASTTGYHSFIAERTGCIAHNYGVGGTRIALDGDSGLSFIHRVANMQNDLDMICVFGGINDASKYELYDSRYGTIEDAILTDEEIADGVTEPSTFYAAVKTLLSQLITKYPEKPIVLIIPPHVLDASYEPSIAAYAGIKKIVDALRECAEYYAIPTIDLYKNAQYLNNHPSNVALYRTATNNIHPNTKAHILMSYDIQKALENIIWK